MKQRSTTFQISARQWISRQSFVPWPWRGNSSLQGKVINSWQENQGHLGSSNFIVSGLFLFQVLFYKVFDIRQTTLHLITILFIATFSTLPYETIILPLVANNTFKMFMITITYDSRNDWCDTPLKMSHLQYYFDLRRKWLWLKSFLSESFHCNE